MRQNGRGSFPNSEGIVYESKCLKRDVVLGDLVISEDCSNFLLTIAICGMKERNIPGSNGRTPSLDLATPFP